MALCCIGYIIALFMLCPDFIYQLAIGGLWVWCARFSQDLKNSKKLGRFRLRFLAFGGI